MPEGEPPRRLGDTGGTPSLAVEDWGLVPYAEALARQEALVERRWRGEVGDTLVLTEHPPVFTLGTRPGAEANLRWSEQERSGHGVELFRLRRGGDVTAHGPGQIVGYPIVDLSGKRDLHRFMRDLEEGLIRAVGCLGLAASRRPGLTGVWIGTRKVAAIGVAVRHWVSWHGFALNVNNDLPVRGHRSLRHPRCQCDLAFPRARSCAGPCRGEGPRRTRVAGGP